MGHFGIYETMYPCPENSPHSAQWVHTYTHTHTHTHHTHTHSADDTSSEYDATMPFSYPSTLLDYELLQTQTSQIG